jgi:hypothetical protein
MTMERDSADCGMDLEGEAEASEPVRFLDADVQRLLAEAGRTWDALQQDLVRKGLRRT